VLLRPDVPAARWGWLPLLTGVAVVSSLPAVGASLKWPNDVLVSGRKLAGILVERVESPAGAAAVVGVGVNVAQPAASLVPGSTSLRALGALPAREPSDAVKAVLARLLRELGRWYDDWVAVDGDPDASGVGAAYRSRCDTLEREVRVERPGADPLVGTAVGINDDGRLVLAKGGGVRTAVSAGDVVHVRATP
jgi:BirA family biotin operon repressor/biotin-[acetyl-CoA-carboxylase] ligase